jgi:hypothetical protein
MSKVVPFNTAVCSLIAYIVRAQDALPTITFYLCTFPAFVFGRTKWPDV